VVIRSQQNVPPKKKSVGHLAANTPREMRGVAPTANGFFFQRDLFFPHPLPTGYLIHRIRSGDFSG
jgi:hypothetical protein